MEKIVHEDKELASSFDKTSAIMGPLGRAWQSVEDWRRNPSDKTRIDIDMLARQIKLAGRMAGQSCNQIVHHRRQKILRAMADDKQTADSLLKQNADALSEEKEKLFGEKFQQKIATSIKASKKTKEFFESMKKLKKGKSKKSEKSGKDNRSRQEDSKRNATDPFQGGSRKPGFNNYRSGGGYQRGGQSGNSTRGNRYGGSPWRNSGKSGEPFKFTATLVNRSCASLCQRDSIPTKHKGRATERREGLVLPAKIGGN